VSAFGGLCIAFPWVAGEIWAFVAPGLYKNEKRAFLPFLIATPVLFVAGASLVYYVVMPLAFRFFIGFENPGGPGGLPIQLETRVSEYLSLVMTLMFAFGLCFQLPVLLTLLARVGIVSAAMLRKGRKYAIVAVFLVAAFLTPPDVISQIGLALPVLLLYEISIFAVSLIEKRRAERDADGSAGP
jgi:sec-independent protein translocase protein TatC